MPLPRRSRAPTRRLLPCCLAVVGALLLLSLVQSDRALETGKPPPLPTQRSAASAPPARQAPTASPLAAHYTADPKCTFEDPPKRCQSQKTVALASVPRSGNTWVRFMIERATGFCTGSVYVDKRLQEMGITCEGRARRVVAVKTHWPFYNETILERQISYDAVILLLRNPFDVLVSHYNLIQTETHSQSLDETAFRGNRTWNAFVKRVTGKMVDFYSGWEAMDVPKLIVHYEDIRASHHDGVRQLGRMLEFLKGSGNVKHLPEERQLDCAVASVNIRKTGRSGSVGRNLEKFTPEQVKIVEDGLGRFMELAGRGGLS